MLWKISPHTCIDFSVNEFVFLHSGLEFGAGDFFVVEGQIPMLTIEYDADMAISTSPCYDSGVSVTFGGGTGAQPGEYW